MASTPTSAGKCSERPPTSENSVKAKFSGIAQLPHRPAPEGLPSGEVIIQPEGIIAVLSTHNRPLLLTISKLLRSYIMADETIGRGLVDDRNSDPSEAASHHLASA